MDGSTLIFRNGRRRGTSEYFIVENRWPHSSFDAWKYKPYPQIDLGVPNQGLGVWHVIENSQIYGIFIPSPPVTSQQDLWEQKWAEVSLSDWGRRGIRMIRPICYTLHPEASLWNGSDPATGYDLLPDSAPPLANLRWADGTPSGFAIRNISPAGAVMIADIQVPW